MGTTSDKLTYLNGTKQALKDSINNIGGSITDETTFRAYAEELDNIYTNLPKTTGEGSNLSLTTLKGRINVDDILGDTTQEGTPTPDTPIDINVVTGTQEVVVQNRNLLDLTSGTAFPSGVNVSNLLVNSLTLTGTSAWSGSAYILPNFEKNTSFTISGKFLSTLARTSGFTIYGTNAVSTSGMTSIIASTSSLEANTQKTYSATFNSGNYDYICIRIWNNYTASALSSSVALEVSKLQLELGSTASSYIEHQEQTKTLHLGDIELCKIGTYQDRISKSSGKNLFSGFIKGKGISASTGVETTNTNAGVSDYIPVNFDLNSNYYISGLTNTLNSLVGAYNSNKDFLGRTGATTTTTWNLTKNSFTNATQGTGDVAYIRVEQYYLSGSTGTIDDIDKLNVMLNEGSTALPYEPYGTNWYIEKNIGKVVLNGTLTENVEINNSQTNTMRVFYNYDILQPSYNNALCNRLPIKSIWSTDEEGIYYGGTSASTKLILRINKDRLSATTLAGFNTWLISNNIVYYYLMRTPITTEITNTTLIEELNNLEKMMSYNGQTNISVSGNLPMLVSVSALKGESE